MGRIIEMGQDELTLLEVVLRVQGDFRQRLAPLCVTPLQAGVTLYLHQQRDAKLKDAATGLLASLACLQDPRMRHEGA